MKNFGYFNLKFCSMPNVVRQAPNVIACIMTTGNVSYLSLIFIKMRVFVSIGLVQFQDKIAFEFGLHSFSEIFLRFRS